MNQLQSHTFCTDTLKLHSDAEAVFLLLAERLRKIRNEKLYEPQWESFSEYLNEMKLTESKASRLISVYEKFCVDWGIEKETLSTAGGWSNLYELGKVASSKEEALEWIERRATAFEPHYREALRAARSGLSECSHNTIYELQIRVCKTCGFKEKLFRSDSTEDLPHSHLPEMRS